MTATLLAKQQVAFFTSQDFSAVKKGHWYAKADGTQAYRLERVAIFRSGTFRDSEGWEHTYDPFHMAQMVNNFSYLRQGGEFPDPPIRCDHPGIFDGGYLKNVVGYVDSLQAVEATSPVDGKSYTYLLADYDILDVEAAKKIDSGLWRHRSAEVGFFETNDGGEFYPVLLGFAYVDIPAVQGLNGSFSKFAKNLTGVGEKFSAVGVDIKEEPNVANENPQTPSVPAAPAAPTAPTPPAAAPAPAPFVFSIAGRQSTDFAAVQAHIAAVETENEELKNFQSETVKAGRESFISSLAADNKILASQVPGLQTLAATMSDEQFGMFRESYSALPVIPTISTPAISPAAQGTPVPPSREEQELEAARRNYQRHVASGIPKDQLERTNSYILLKAKGEIV